MKKELLLELLEIIKNYDQSKINFIFQDTIDVSIKIDRLLKLTDEEVCNILNTNKSKYVTLSKLYFYLNKDKISKDILPVIKKSLEEENVNTYYALQLLGCPNEIPKIYLIINAKERYQAKQLLRLFTDENVLKHSDNVLELAKVILETKNEWQAQYACDALCDENLLMSGNALEISKKIASMDEKFKVGHILSLVLDGDISLLPLKEKYIELISNTKNEWQANHVRKLATYYYAAYYNSEAEKRLYELTECFANSDDYKKSQYAWEYIRYFLNPCFPEKNDLIIEIAKMIINTKHLTASECIYMLSCKKTFLEHDKALEFIKVLADLDDWRINDCYNIIDNPNFILKEDALEILKMVASAKESFQSSWAKQSIVFSDLIKRDDAKEIIEVLLNTEEIFQAKYATLLATNKNVSNHSQALDIVKLVVSSKERYHAVSLETVLTNNNVLNHKEVLEIGKIILDTKTPYQAADAGEVVTIEKVLERDDTLDIIKMFATSKNEKISDYAVKVAKTTAIERKDAKEILQLVLDSKHEYQAKCAYELARNENLIKQEQAIELIKRITTTRGKRKVNKLKNMILEEFQFCEESLSLEEERIEQPINQIKELDSRDSVIGLIEALQNSNEEEITPNTVIKVKTINSNNTKRSTN